MIESDNKKLLRREIKTKLLSLSKEQKNEYTLKITERVLYFLENINYKKIGVFLSTDTEVDTHYLINYLIDKNKDVYAPVIKDDQMFFCPITNSIKYIINNFGIREPQFTTPETNLDVIITPLVAFDKNKNRLGHGCGFYDKFFVNKSCYKIGICFSLQQAFSVFPNSHDIPLDVIITEQNIFN